MAGDSESVGRLLAIDALMKGDRELLRQHDKPDPKAPQPKPNQTAPALSVDPKATAAVLLKLLDDRLLASEAQAANAKRAAGSSELLSDDAQGAPKYVSARYAADGLPPGFDNGRTETPIPTNQSAFGNAIPAAAPDMQTFIQRFAALMAGRPSATIAAGGDSIRKFSMLGAIGGRRGAMTVAIVLFVLWMISGLAPG
jgi:hypothetical protein